MIVTLPPTQPTSAPTTAESIVALTARQRIDRHSHFRHRADQFDLESVDDVLIVRGIVPSFYLKQLLQSALMDIDGVRRIDNRVEVVSSCGLSST